MTELINWDNYPNFSKAEFDCQETGENEMQPVFLYELQRLRNAYGKPMRITSGYRSPKHSIEAAKQRPGRHAQGIAVDIAVNGVDAYVLLKLAFAQGCFTGIGVDKHFIHLDIAPDRKSLWVY